MRTQAFIFQNLLLLCLGASTSVAFAAQRFSFSGTKWGSTMAEADEKLKEAGHVIDPELRSGPHTSIDLLDFFEPFIPGGRLGWGRGDLAV